MGKTLKNIAHRKGLLFFILAYFCYIDGVGTVIHMSTSYGETLNLDTVGMILALLVTQIVAVPCSILFGRLAQKVGSVRMIAFAIGVYFLICLVGFYMGFSVEAANGAEDAIHRAEILFWIMAAMVGMVQGGIQALSRSYFGKLIPANKSNEYFGFFDIFGKFATVVGPLLVSLVTDLTNRSSLGILSLLVLFAVGGLLLFLGRNHMKGEEAAVKQEEAEEA